jgi:SPP1 gp7 family putative phage head morphogenesis protein
MLQRLSLPLLPLLALPALLPPSAPKSITLDAHDDSSAHKQPKAGSLGRPTSHPLTIEQAAAKRASKDFERLRTEVNLLLSEHSGTNAAELLMLLRKRLGRIIDTPELRKWAADRVTEIARFNAAQISRSVGIKVPELLSKATQQRLTNRVIASARGVPRDVVNRIAPTVRRAIATGERGKAFELEIAAKLELSHKAARKVAIGTVLRANSALTEERHKALGITEYVWRCSPDRHTRRWHRALNGQRCKYADPPEGGGGGPYDVGNPGSADRCRCQAIPVIPERPKTLRRVP